MNPKEKREKAIRRQQEIIDKAKAEKRDLTAEEQREFEEQQEIVEAATREIMQEESKKGEPEDHGSGAKDQDNAARAADLERKRILDIQNLGRQFDVNVERFIESNASIEQVREAVLETLYQRNTPEPGSRADAEVTKDEEDKFRDAMSDALLMRGGVHVEHPAEGARDLRGMSLRDIAIESLKDDERNARRMSSEELFVKVAERQYYNPSAAFPSIMDQTVKKAYTAGYNLASTTFERFCSEGSLSDFKTSKHEYLAGPAGLFERVPENGELKSDKPEDTLMSTRKLETYGKQFTMSRQAFINDDIGFLTTIPARYARAGKTTINQMVYEILIKNMVIADGIAIFDTNHKNLVTKKDLTGKPTGKAFQAMITAMASQKNQFGQPIIIRPACIILPVGYGFAAQTILQSATINTPENTQAANPLYHYRTQIEVVEDPTINALAGDGNVPWFMAANKGDCKGIQVDYLNGNKIPTIRRAEKPGTLGFIWDVYHDWGISVVDHRGFVKNPGEKLAIAL